MFLRSLINNNGPSIDTGGTPDKTGVQLEADPATTVRCDREVR